MHVSGTYIPLAYIVRDIYEIECGIEVVLPATPFVYEEREHLVKVKEVRLRILN